FFTPGEGLVVREESWADRITFGPLVLTCVPVMEATPTEEASGGPHFEGELGLAALKRLDLIVDGGNGRAYLRTKTTAPPPYRHNRLGAEFVPTESPGSELVARVAGGSPAEEAGIRDGDVLLKLD